MAVMEAVVAFDKVINKAKQILSDMPIQEPGFDKVINKLEKKRRFLVDCEEEEDQGRQEKVKKWVDKYLNIFYKVEDDIDTFALALARQRWRETHSRIGYFFYHCAGPFFFFNNHMSCRDLRIQMMRIGSKINLLRREMTDKSHSHQPDRQNSVANSDNNNIDDNHRQAEKEEGEVVHQAQEEEVEGISAMSQTGPFNDLLVHRKLCLLYLALFPKESDIPVRRLVRLWHAEGFVESLKDKEPEDVANEYFDDLVNRNLIQISKFRSDGSPRRCRLHGDLHDYLLRKSEDIGLFHVHRSNSDCAKEATGGRLGLRRIVEYLDIKIDKLDFSRLQYLRSYISFNIQKKDIPAKEVAHFVRKITCGRGFGLLRVLDLEGVYKPSLTDKLRDLFHLRYLGLRWTFLDNLPPSVGDLPHLETLDLKHTYINSLPNSIWKLKHLRHLNLNEIRLDMPKQPRSPLFGLLTLWGLFVDDKSLVKNGLSKLRNLRELGITFNLIPSSSLDLADWISELTSLQSLRLRSKDERGRPSKLDLKTLSALGKLSHLNLKVILQKLPDIHAFPPALKVLTLSFSRLTEDPMPTLGQLQSLTVLRLLANSYLGKKIVCPPRGFSKLRDLKLWMLNDLVEWDVKEEAMPNLKKLNIRGCDNLSALPPSLLQRTTLEELILTKMPESFVAEVQRQKSDHTYLTVNNNWDFTALPAEWYEEEEEEEEEEENVSHRRG